MSPATVALALAAALSLPTPKQRVAALDELERGVETWVSRRATSHVTRFWLPVYGLWLSVDDERRFAALEAAQAQVETARIQAMRGL